MMPCNNYRRLISRYIDNDLDSTVRSSVENHMASCGCCKETLNGYTALKRLVIESHALSVPEARIPAPKPAHGGTRLRFPMWTTGWKLAAMVTIVFLLAAGIYIHATSKNAGSFPMVIEHESRAVMNTPLGALVYYEEIAGKTVHAQYGGIKETSRSLYERSNASWRKISSYESLLFYDNSLIDQKYESLANVSEF